MFGSIEECTYGVDIGDEFWISCEVDMIWVGVLFGDGLDIIDFGDF